MKVTSKLALIIALFLSELAVLAPPASAACDTEGAGAVDAVLVEAECVDSPAVTPGGDPPAEEVSDDPPYVEYLWNSVCLPFDPGDETPQPPDCQAARTCADPAERAWELWGRRPAPDAGWDLLGSECFGRPPGPGETPRPRVTPGVVLSALRRVGLPALGVRTQPEGTTLVNFATIFFVEPVEFDRSLRLLGRSVRVQAWPVSFVWHHGDGTSSVSEVPGAPYPSKQVTYAYRDAGVSVAPWVEVVYAARFRVGSGPWREVGETVSVAGPESSLRVAEATAVLSGEYR